LGLWTGVGRAQETPADDLIDTIRPRSDIGVSDQQRIAEWVEGRVNEFAGFEAFTERIKTCYEHPSNAQPFRTQLCIQTARVAAAQFARADLNRDVAHALAQILIDMNRVEAFPGVVAGLKSTDVRARYLCAKGLGSLQRAISGDQATFDQAVEALRVAGLAESDPVVLGRIYQALAYPSRVGDVFESYLNLLDKRLQDRRGAAVKADGAEIFAYEFFRTPAVVAGLDQGQKAQLVGRLAVFLRLDAQRYNDPTIAPPQDKEMPDLNFDERDRIERMLDAVEELLESIVGAGRGGSIREALSAGAYDERQAVLREAYRWVGDPEANEPGALNEAPWNVAVGAP
jgi:hypothetical protein